MNRDPGEIPMALESQRLWEAMDKRIGADVGFKRSGIVYLADNEAAMAKHEEWLGHAAPYQLGTRLLRGAELASVVPGMKRAFAGGIYTPLDARAEPFRAVPAIAKRVVELGGHVLTGCAVRGLDIQGGRVAGVITEKGRIRCQRAVLAGGAWSRLFLGNLGIDFPQLKVRGSVMRTKPMSGTPEFAVVPATSPSASVRMAAIPSRIAGRAWPKSCRTVSASSAILCQRSSSSGMNCACVRVAFPR